MEWMKISCWIQLVWDLWKMQGEGQSSRAGPAREVPLQASTWLRTYNVTSQTGRVNIQGTLITKTVTVHISSQREGLNRVQEISYLGVWHFASWKEVLGAKKMQMCDLKYRGLINMVDFLPTKIKWSISSPNQAAPSPFEEPIQRSKRLLI